MSCKCLTSYEALHQHSAGLKYGVTSLVEKLNLSCKPLIKASQASHNCTIQALGVSYPLLCKYFIRDRNYNTDVGHLWVLCCTALPCGCASGTIEPQGVDYFTLHAHSHGNSTSMPSRWLEVIWVKLFCQLPIPCYPWSQQVHKACWLWWSQDLLTESHQLSITLESA